MENLEVNRNDYSLSIRVNSDGFSLSILDQSGAMLVMRDVSAALFQMRKDEIIELFEAKMGVVPAEYNDVRLIVESDSYVFVPAPVFKMYNIDDYFYFQHEKDKKQLVLFNRIQDWSTVNVFSIPLELNEALNDLFQDSVITHQLSYFLSERIKTKEDCVYIWVRPKILDAVVVKSGILMLINSFVYYTPEDFTYFILSIFDQLKLDTEKIAVNLYQRNNSVEFKELISMYIKTVQLFDGSKV